MQPLLKVHYKCLIAWRVLPNSHGCLAMTFAGHIKYGKTSSHMSTVEVSSSQISEETGETILSNNSQQLQNKIEQQAL